jgi:thiamine biosynthesis protein ThiS
VKLRVNGVEREVAAGTTVAALVLELGLSPERVAVERNARLVPRRLQATTPLVEGDVLEVVTLVGGG